MTTSKTRIYAVHDAGLNTCHLVRATNPAAAVRFIARKQYTPEVATQERLVSALSSGQQVLDAASNGDGQE
jgi:hypothetical protein